MSSPQLSLLFPMRCRCPILSPLAARGASTLSSIRRVRPLLGDRRRGRLATWQRCARTRGRLLLINPVHASQPVSPLETSRTCRCLAAGEPDYIRPESIGEFASLPQASREAIEQLRDVTREFASREDLIDRDRAWEAKRKALKLFSPRLVPTIARSQFDHFVENGGSSCLTYALCALVEREDTLELPRTSSVPRRRALN